MESIVIYMLGPDQSRLVSRLLQITIVSSIYPIKLNKNLSTTIAMYLISNSLNISVITVIIIKLIKRTYTRINQFYHQFTPHSKQKLLFNNVAHHHQAMRHFAIYGSL